jgi:hypothetical protein
MKGFCEGSKEQGLLQAISGQVDVILFFYYFSVSNLLTICFSCNLKRGKDRLLCQKASNYPGEEQVQYAKVPHGRTLLKHGHHHPSMD